MLCNFSPSSRSDEEDLDDETAGNETISRGNNKKTLAEQPNVEREANVKVKNAETKPIPKDQKKSTSKKMKFNVVNEKTFVNTKKGNETQNGFKIEEILTEIEEKPYKVTEISSSTNKVKGKPAPHPSTGQIDHSQKKNKIKRRPTKVNLLKGTKNKKINKPNKTQSSKTKVACLNKPSISDERLRAFGLNPKKFHKKLKYGRDSKATPIGTPTNGKKILKKSTKTDKLNQKKTKRKLMTILGK